MQHLVMRRIFPWWPRASAPVRVAILFGVIVVVGSAVAYVGDRLDILQGHLQWLYIATFAAMIFVWIAQVAGPSGKGN
jgi:hypothetical protein